MRDRERPGPSENQATMLVEKNIYTWKKKAKIRGWVDLLNVVSKSE